MIQVLCDRCGQPIIDRASRYKCTLSSMPDVGYGYSREFDICKDCRHEVRKYITGKEYKAGYIDSVKPTEMDWSPE